MGIKFYAPFYPQGGIEEESQDKVRVAPSRFLSFLSYARDVYNRFGGGISGLL